MAILILVGGCVPPIITTIIIRYCNNDIINKPNYLYIAINYDL